jgi:hypothetical protein
MSESSEESKISARPFTTQKSLLEEEHRMWSIGMNGYGSEDVFMGAPMESIPMNQAPTLKKADSKYMDMQQEEEVFQDLGFDSGYGSEDFTPMYQDLSEDDNKKY